MSVYAKAICPNSSEIRVKEYRFRLKIIRIKVLGQSQSHR